MSPTQFLRKKPVSSFGFTHRRYIVLRRSCVQWYISAMDSFPLGRFQLTQRTMLHREPTGSLTLDGSLDGSRLTLLFDGAATDGAGALDEWERAIHGAIAALSAPTAAEGAAMAPALVHQSSANQAQGVDEELATAVALSLQTSNERDAALLDGGATDARVEGGLEGRLALIEGNLSLCDECFAVAAHPAAEEEQGQGQSVRATALDVLRDLLPTLLASQSRIQTLLERGDLADEGAVARLLKVHAAIGRAHGQYVELAPELAGAEDAGAEAVEAAAAPVAEAPPAPPGAAVSDVAEVTPPAQRASAAAGAEIEVGGLLRARERAVQRLRTVAL